MVMFGKDVPLFHLEVHSTVTVVTTGPYLLGFVSALSSKRIQVLIMPMKRRRSASHSSNDNYSEVYSEVSNGEDSDFQDASFSPKKVSLERKPATTKKATKGRVDNPSTSVVIERVPHSRTTHVIQDASSMRVALLKWYDTVHETRGMPWRKVYDPKLGPEERAQRAYEVLVISKGFITNLSNEFRNRCGSLKSCYNRPRWRQLFHITTVGCPSERYLPSNI